MKRLILLTLLLISGAVVVGNPVDEATAKQVAQNFWKENNIEVIDGKLFKKNAPEANFVNVASQGGYSEFYVFSNMSGKGFVIVSADDRMTPILGYSYENDFVMENMPVHVKSWMDHYAEQIAYAAAEKIQATDEIRNDWNRLLKGLPLPLKSKTAVEPLVETHWGQGTYYNDLCPYDSTYNTRTLVGCGATAMAQVLKYWSYGEHGYGSFCYVPISNPEYGEQCADFANTTYEWDEMPNELTSPNLAVATLMYHCAVALSTNFGVMASSTAGGKAYVFGWYFGIYPTNGYAVKDSYSDEQWKNFLKDDLNHSRPILYNGVDPIVGGHVFVCDGYDANDMFHFNFGWEGIHDGYYSLNNVHGFSSNQNAILGLDPNIPLSPDQYEPNNTLATAYPLPVAYSGTNGSVEANNANIQNGSDIDYYRIDLEMHYDYFVDVNIYDYFMNPAHTADAVLEYSTDGLEWSEEQDVYARIVLPGGANEETIYVRVSQREEYQLGTYSMVVDVYRTPAQPPCYIYVDSAPWEGGSVYGGGSFWPGDVCTVTAIPSEGWELNSWRDENDSIVSTDLCYTFIVDSGRTLIAEFWRIFYLNVEVIVEPSAGGTVTGAGLYTEGQVCTLVAHAAPDWSFFRWTDAGAPMTTDTIYSFVVERDHDIVAWFGPANITITSSAGPNGTISPLGITPVEYGQDVTFEMLPDPNCRVNEVYVDGNLVGSPSSYTFEFVETDHTIFVSFMELEGVDEANEDEVAIYPNPTSGIVVVQCKGAETIKVYDTFGATIISESVVDKDNYTLNLADHAPGVYLLEITAGGKKSIKKIVKM
jgi:hypothetical protein